MSIFNLINNKEDEIFSFDPSIPDPNIFILMGVLQKMIHACPYCNNNKPVKIRRKKLAKYARSLYKNRSIELRRYRLEVKIRVIEHTRPFMFLIYQLPWEYIKTYDLVFNCLKCHNSYYSVPIPYIDIKNIIEGESRGDL